MFSSSMLINQVPEEENGLRSDDVQSPEDNSNEYQTADELYRIMARNHPFEGDGDNALTTRDLVILYKNIDLGTKLMSFSNEQTSKSPNQYVETVIYNDDKGSEGSDVSEDITTEDFSDVITINNERIDLLSSIEDTLCHKYGKIQLQSSDLTVDYDRHFLFNDTFLKNQLENCHAISKSKQSDSTMFPASLLDYICCKRLEDNYNFYMDNIIKYVQHTIEQLKRISNGDYLTEKAKEKWREVNSGNSQETECTKNVLVSATTIPLHVVGKHSGKQGTWDDIVHSEMDVRSLSKILEKKIILEVPKILCGSYKLFSKRHKDNFIITCKKDGEVNKKSRVDVVLKLQRSNSGHVISNIDSVMILKSSSLRAKTEPCSNNLLPLEFQQDNHMKKEEQNAKIIELDENHELNPVLGTIETVSLIGKDEEVEEFSETNDEVSTFNSDRDDQCRNVADLNFTVFEDLHCKIHRLNMQSPLLEESEDYTKKKKSPTRVRIKSPYENKSHILEEKKRKKLIEIREKREKRKNALNENCKITKHKYGRSAITAQPSTSVTKLSITNKSFYNSIYGQNVISNKTTPKYHKNSIPSIEVQENEETECRGSPSITPEKNNQKYINRSYYLDDADTEVMHLEMNQNVSENEAKDSPPSTLAMSTNDVGISLNMLKRLIGPYTTDDSLTDTSSSLQQNVVFEDNISSDKVDTRINALMSTRSTQVTVPVNTPKKENYNGDKSCEIVSSVECRKSIDKIYNLMKKISTADNIDIKCSKSKIEDNSDKLDVRAAIGSSSIPASDSGTSIKHQLTSSNPSCFSFEKTNDILSVPKKIKQEQTVPVIPKVIISSKLKTNNNSNKKLTPIKIQENPLKAISQLLHDFDNVQKMRNKNTNEIKRNKKYDSLTSEEKNNTRQNSLKRTQKQDEQLRNSEASSRFSFYREKKRLDSIKESSKISHLQRQTDENTFDKTNRKKIADIIDEVKELRGEAVRGPSKKLSRLNSLAQPKKTFTQAHVDEAQNRFGKRTTTEKVHKQPMIPISIPERSTGLACIRQKQKRGLEGVPATARPQGSTGLPIERPRADSLSRHRRSTNNSPSRDGKRSPVFSNKASYNSRNVNNVTETLNGKMSAVETYVKSHYGRVSPAMNLGDAHNALKSRVPLIPMDIDLASMASSPSAEESNVLGNKLHNMIDTMINTNGRVLGALSEGNESSCKLGSDDPDDSVIENISKCDEIISASDYPVDIFQDKNIITAVSRISEDDKDDDPVSNANVSTNVTSRANTCNELKKLENALYRQLSSGTFQKRLRIKNLTLTPKQSLEKVLILQSGDVGSLFLQSTLSQNTDAQTDSLSEIKILPVLSNHRIDFGFTKFPVQLTTVGYAFPQRFVKCDSLTKIHTLTYENTLRSKEFSMITEKNVKNPTFNKSIQCFKSVDIKPFQELMERRETRICLLENTPIHEVSCEECATEIYHNETREFNKTETINNINKPDIKQKCVKDCEALAIDMQNNETRDEFNRTETVEGINETGIHNNSNNINDSTSLDILVALLNEIKKITSCQAELTKSACNIDLNSKELEIILDRAAVQESSVDIMNGLSGSSIGNLQQLQTSISNYSINLSSKVEHKNEPKISKNVSVITEFPLQDKYISLKNFQKNILGLTETPSRFFPVTVGTNVTDSLIKLIYKSSSQSVKSTNYLSMRSSKTAQEAFKNSKKSNQPIISAQPVIIYKAKPLKDKDEFKDTSNKQLREKNNAIIDFDPVMKMKRDILVTVYSILVFTVFAALSFPEIMYQV